LFEAQGVGTTARCTRWAHGWHTIPSSRWWSPTMCRRAPARGAP